MVRRLTKLTGLNVFTEDGFRVGSMKDVLLDPDNGKVLGILIPKPSERFLKKVGLDPTSKVILPYDAIKSVGDIVLIKNVVLGVKS